MYHTVYDFFFFFVGSFGMKKSVDLRCSLGKICQLSVCSCLLGIGDEEVPRKWVTFNENEGKVHCSFCMMYADEKNQHNLMIRGCNDWRHVTARLIDHEKSDCHTKASQVYFIHTHGNTVKDKLLQDQLSLKKAQVLKRRAVVACIIDIIFYIGGQAIAYRSSNSERLDKAFEVDDMENRGNFLEAVKLLAGYNPDLREHLDKNG